MFVLVRFDNRILRSRKLWKRVLMAGI